MDNILAKAQALAAERESIDRQRKAAKLDKYYQDIQFRLREVLGEDAVEIIDGAKPHYTESEDNVYLQNGDWLFDNAGYYDKPTASVIHIGVERSWSNNWEHFSDLATFGRAISKSLELVKRQQEQKQRDNERAEAYYNANPDRHYISLFKRLVVDLDARSNNGRDWLNPAQRVLVAMAGYFAEREQIPDWEDEDSEQGDEGIDNGD